MRFVLMIAAMALFGACAGNPSDAVNVLPDWEPSEDTSVPVDGGVADAASFSELPAHYRFETVTIEQLGSEGIGAFLTLFLQLQWEADLTSYKWNQVFSVEAGEGVDNEVGVQVLSAVGSNEASLCALPSAQSDINTTVFEDGGFAFEFARLNIYTEDDEGTPFNCSADERVGNMIPLKAIQGTLSISADWDSVAGAFTGCLTEADTLALCSCIGDCVPGNAHPGCPGCPEGSAPLKESLGNIVPTEACSSILGEPAFDLKATFTANRLDSLITNCD